VWRRRTGVIYRPPILGATTMPRRLWRYSIDGGEDAPLTTRGRVVFWGALALVVVAGSALLAWSR
jgi:hypothetical protein